MVKHIDFLYKRDYNLYNQTRFVDLSDGTTLRPCAKRTEKVRIFKTVIKKIIGVLILRRRIWKGTLKNSRNI